MYGLCILDVYSIYFSLVSARFFELAMRAVSNCFITYIDNTALNISFRDSVLVDNS